MSTTQSGVVVGVDGSETAQAALAWAADECQLRRVILHVIHAPGGVGDEDGNAGPDLLEAAARTVAARHPNVRVQGELRHDKAAAALIERSADVELVVVGTRGGGSFTASILGSVSHEVITHAHCPVVVVSPGSKEPAPGEVGRVVVGVAAGQAGRLALATACAEAVRRGVALTAVQAHPADEPVDEHRAAAALAVLAECRTQFPDVVIETTVVTAEPGEAVLAAADGAGLVVVGCHHSEDRWSTRLGPVATTVLQGATCPVMIVGR